MVPTQYGDTAIITGAERTPSEARQKLHHSARALWLGIKAASSSRLVVPVFAIAR